MTALTGARRASLVGLYALALTTAAFAKATTTTTTLLSAATAGHGAGNGRGHAGNAKVDAHVGSRVRRHGLPDLSHAHGVYGPPSRARPALTHTSWSLVNGTTLLVHGGGLHQRRQRPDVAMVPAHAARAADRRDRDVRRPTGDARLAAVRGRDVVHGLSQDSAAETVVQRAGQRTSLAPPFVDAESHQRHALLLPAARRGCRRAQSELSVERVWRRPLPPPPAAAPVVTAVAGNARVTLTWNALPDATSYKIYRSDDRRVRRSGDREHDQHDVQELRADQRHHLLLPVAGTQHGRRRPALEAVSATPVAPPRAPQPRRRGRRQGRHAVVGAVRRRRPGYNVYRGTSSNARPPCRSRRGDHVAPSSTPRSANGPTYFYKVTATNARRREPALERGQRQPQAPAPPVDPDHAVGVPAAAAGDMGTEARRRRCA